MKKLITVILILFAQQLYSQTRLTPEKTLDLLHKTNYTYCQTLDVIIRCMFDYNEEKFNSAMDSLKLVRNNYNIIEKEGTLTGNSSQISMARASFNVNKWSVLSLFFDKEEYKNGERKKKVTYASTDRKIPKKLKKQFDKLVKTQTDVCLSNMW